MLIRAIVILIVFYAMVILIASIDSDTDGADYLIVMGHALLNDMPTPILAMRLDKAYRYLKKNPDCKLVLTGGKTHNAYVSEAYAMKEYLETLGYDCSKAIMDNYATDTVENISNSIGLIDYSKKIVICSSSYHIFRIKLICLKFGLDCKFIAAPTPFFDLVIHLAKEEIAIIKTAIELK